MPVYVSTTYASDMSSVIDAAKGLKTRSIDHIELGSIHKPEPDVAVGLMGLGCRFITHNYFPPGNERAVLNISAQNETVRARSLEFMKKAIDFAVKIHAPLYTIHPGFCCEEIAESKVGDNYDFHFNRFGYDIPDRTKRYFGNLITSVNILGDYIKDKDIRIAVETQGSVSEDNFVFMDKPEDFEAFLAEMESPKVGLNLNLGHVNLASRKHGFDKMNYPEGVMKRIYAVEVSHNNALLDEHLGLKEDGWYMEFLKKGSFKNLPVIFEGRDIGIEDTVKSYNMLKNILG